MKTRLSFEGRLKFANEFAPAMTLWPWFSIGIRPCITQGKKFYIMVNGYWIVDVLIWPRLKRHWWAEKKIEQQNGRKER